MSSLYLGKYTIEIKNKANLINYIGNKMYT